MSLSHRLWIGMLLLCGSVVAQAIDPYEFNHPAQEAQYKGLVEELRCPKCQNQNLAGSDAPIAQDLKQQTYDMVMDGQTDQQIRDYMIDRYGDFITYRPPVRPSTWVLWFFPPLLLVSVLVGWLIYVHRRQRQTAAQQLSPAEQARLADILRQANDKSAPTQAPKTVEQTGDRHDT
ncbi:MAG: cytochrome c-type biogenesis protein [Pseudomonadota bacterium]|nr:cytochrome c-type biogenesis protein [Pseudomonadota bacterium]